ncbi:MAG: tRNA lysidine(34) synthetase TilS, partial [Acidimicrobiales bacterium]
MPALAGELLARCCFAEDSIDAAVSGGVDSLALLILAVATGREVTAFHVDHGLRPGSGAEAERVGAAAAGLGAGFRSLSVRVEPGPNLEARARAARRAVLPPGVATGHTADDQAETVLLNLIRGAGLAGLAGMRAGPGHPILALRRADTERLCAEAGLEPLLDPSNADGRFRRNRIRHEVLPLLGAVAERDVAGVIARQTRLLGEDEDLLESLAAAIDPTSVTALAGAPPPLARRALRRWLTSEEGYPPSAAAIERVMAVVRLEARAAEIEGGVVVSRRSGRLSRPAPPAQTPPARPARP